MVTHGSAFWIGPLAARGRRPRGNRSSAAQRRHCRTTESTTPAHPTQALGFPPSSQRGSEFRLQAERAFDFDSNTRNLVELQRAAARGMAGSHLSTSVPPEGGTPNRWRREGPTSGPSSVEQRRDGARGVEPLRRRHTPRRPSSFRPRANAAPPNSGTSPSNQPTSLRPPPAASTRRPGSIPRSPGHARIGEDRRDRRSLRGQRRPPAIPFPRRRPCGGRRPTMHSSALTASVSSLGTARD